MPVWYGARFQCEKVPKHAVLRVLKQQAVAAHSQEVAAHKALDLEKQQREQQPQPQQQGTSQEQA